MQRLPISDPSEIQPIHAAVTALRAGRLVVLPTETVYGLAADPRNADAVRDLCAVKGRRPEQPFTHHLASIEQINALAAPPPPRILRFLERVWPGPLTMILGARDGEGEVGLRVPAHPFTTRVIAEMGHSLFMTSVNRTDQPPIQDPSAIAAAFADEPRIALLADAGTPSLGEPSVVVRFRGRRLEVLREGILDAQELMVGAATKILFLCTGNTCRSPLAEVLAEKLIADRLGVRPDEVLAHGLCFRSAGTGTLAGMPASGGSVKAAAEKGLDLSDHRSTALTTAMIDESDRVYCLSRSHLDDVLRVVPEAAAKTSLLGSHDASVPDPFGGSLDIYRRTRDAIEKHLRARLDEILAL